VSGPASYLTLRPGTAVHDRLEAPVGKVKRVLQHGDGCFDGILVATPVGDRFVDAHEVRNVSSDVVHLEVTRAEVETGDPDRPNAPRPRAPALRRMLGLGDRVPVARWGRTEASDREREAAVDALKRAYIDDRITDDELSELVGRAHDAKTIAELEQLLARCAAE
jgi:hypothetical protein